MKFISDTCARLDEFEPHRRRAILGYLAGRYDPQPFRPDVP